MHIKILGFYFFFFEENFLFKISFISEALIIDPNNVEFKSKEKICLEKIEDFLKECDQWMKDKKYENLEDKTWVEFLSNSKEEWNLTNKSLDNHGMSIFYKVLADKQCKITILILDNVK